MIIMIIGSIISIVIGEFLVSHSLSSGHQLKDKYDCFTNFANTNNPACIVVSQLSKASQQMINTAILALL